MISLSFHMAAFCCKAAPDLFLTGRVALSGDVYKSRRSAMTMRTFRSHAPSSEVNTNVPMYALLPQPGFRRSTCWPRCLSLDSQTSYMLLRLLSSHPSEFEGVKQLSNHHLLIHLGRWEGLFRQTIIFESKESFTRRISSKHR